MRHVPVAGSISRPSLMRLLVSAAGPAGCESSVIDGASGADALDGEAHPVGEVVFDGVHDGLSGVVVVDLADAQQQAAAGDVEGGSEVGGGFVGGEFGQSSVDGDAAVAVEVGVQGLGGGGEAGGGGGGGTGGGGGFRG